MNNDVFQQLRAWVETRPDCDSVDFMIETLRDGTVNPGELMQILTWLQTAYYSGIFPFLDDQVNQPPKINS